MKILVTGATGFVGRALLADLQQYPQFSLRAAVRRGACDVGGPSVSQVVVADLGSGTDWQAALAGVDVVVHLAARVHVLDERATNPLAAFRAVNVAGSVRLAQEAASAGVRRMVYVSSAKVHGENSLAGHAFNEDCAPAPQGPYAVSKLETEQALRTIAATSGLQLTIIRPPLVYGSGVGANFAALANAVARGIPLPLGAIDNQRSLVSIDNLVNLITHCITHPAAANQTFLASDGEDLSTTALVRRIAQAMRRPSHLLPVPTWMLVGGAYMLGRQGASRRLCGNLQIDSSKARTVLGWRPPVTVDEGLRRAVASYCR